MTATDTEPIRSKLPSWGLPAGTGGRRPRAARSHLPHALLALACFAAYQLVSVIRYQRFGSPSWDLGIFTEAVKGYAHLGAPIVDIKGPGFNILGDHWSPVTALLAPAWWVWPSPVMLLTAQSALFASSVWVVSDTAARFTSRNRALLIGAAYGLSWGIQRAVDVEFHEIAFAVPVVALVGRQLLLRRWFRAAGWALPLVLVKEDMGLTVAAVGAVLLLNRRWWLGAGLVVFGAGATAAEVWWLIPHFNTAHHFQYWDKMPGGSVGHTHWWNLLWAPFTRWTVWRTTVWTLGITCFLCLRSPLLILALPTLAWRFTSSNPTYWDTGWHYSAVVMPIVFLALVDALCRMEASRRIRVRAFADRSVTAVLALAVACTVSLPTGVGVLGNRSAWQGGPRAAALRAAVRLVPQGATVESDDGAMAVLAARDDVYWIGGDRAGPEWIVIEAWSGGPKDMPAYGTQLHPGVDYRAVLARDGVTVLKRQ